MKNLVMLLVSAAFMFGYLLRAYTSAVDSEALSERTPSNG